MQLDYGMEKAVGLSAMVQFARSQKGQAFEKYLQKIRSMTFRQFINNNDSLVNASNYGFSPIDCVRERISWTMLRKRYSVSDLVQWGMTFQTASKIGLQPQHLGGDKGFEVLENMKATKEDIKSFLFNFEALKSSKLSPETLKKIGFSFQDLIDSGCNATNMRQLTNCDIKTMVLAFQPTPQEWLEAKFNDANIKAHGWDASLYRRFIAAETSRVGVPAVQAREGAALAAGVKNMRMARQVVPPAPESMAKQFERQLNTEKLLNFKLNISNTTL